MKQLQYSISLYFIFLWIQVNHDSTFLKSAVASSSCITYQREEWNWVVRGLGGAELNSCLNDQPACVAFLCDRTGQADLAGMSDFFSCEVVMDRLGSTVSFSSSVGFQWYHGQGLKIAKLHEQLTQLPFFRPDLRFLTEYLTKQICWCIDLNPEGISIKWSIYILLSKEWRTGRAQMLDPNCPALNGQPHSPAVWPWRCNLSPLWTPLPTRN